MLGACGELEDAHFSALNAVGVWGVSGQERIFFIFLELTAACLFGTLLGELQVVEIALCPE